MDASGRRVLTWNGQTRPATFPCAAGGGRIVGWGSGTLATVTSVRSRQKHLAAAVTTTALLGGIGSAGVPSAGAPAPVSRVALLDRPAGGSFPSDVQEAMDYAQRRSRVSPLYAPLTLAGGSGQLTPWVFASAYEVDVSLVNGGTGNVVASAAEPSLSSIVAAFSLLRYSSHADAVGQLEGPRIAGASKALELTHGLTASIGHSTSSSAEPVTLVWSDRGWGFSVLAPTPQVAVRRADALVVLTRSRLLPPAPGYFYSIVPNGRSGGWSDGLLWVALNEQVAAEAASPVQALDIADSMRRWP
jgi:hypothetical protein